MTDRAEAAGASDWHPESPEVLFHRLSIPMRPLNKALSARCPTSAGQTRWPNSTVPDAQASGLFGRV